MIRQSKFPGVIVYKEHSSFESLLLLQLAKKNIDLLFLACQCLHTHPIFYTIYSKIAYIGNMRKQLQVLKRKTGNSPSLYIIAKFTLEVFH